MKLEPFQKRRVCYQEDPVLRPLKSGPKPWAGKTNLSLASYPLPVDAIMKGVFFFLLSKASAIVSSSETTEWHTGKFQRKYKLPAQNYISSKNTNEMKVEKNESEMGTERTCYQAEKK